MDRKAKSQRLLETLTILLNKPNATEMEILGLDREQFLVFEESLKVVGSLEINGREDNTPPLSVAHALKNSKTYGKALVTLEVVIPNRPEKPVSQPDELFPTYDEGQSSVVKQVL